MRGTLGALLTILALAAPAAGSQSPIVAGDTSVEVRAARAGHDAGGRPGIGGRVLGGFAAGVPIGFFGPIAGAGAAIAGGGVAGIAAFAVSGSARPPRALADSAAAQGPAYAQAFGDAYHRRLRTRRTLAAVGGGLLGTALGLAALLSVLSSFDD